MAEVAKWLYWGNVLLNGLLLVIRTGSVIQRLWVLTGAQCLCHVDDGCVCEPLGIVYASVSNGDTWKINMFLH